VHLSPCPALHKERGVLVEGRGASDLHPRNSFLLAKCLIFNVDQSCRYVYSGQARVRDRGLGRTHREVGGCDAETKGISVVLDALD
jgi:hypothetical protein